MTVFAWGEGLAGRCMKLTQGIASHPLISLCTQPVASAVMSPSLKILMAAVTLLFWPEAPYRSYSTPGSSLLPSNPAVLHTPNPRLLLLHLPCPCCEYCVCTVLLLCVKH